MHIKDQRLTVQLEEDTALVTITFTVVVQPHDLVLGGGFLETIDLSSPLSSWVIQKRRSLPLDGAVKPKPTATYKELNREHTFRVPRYPAGPLTTVKFHGYIAIWPSVPMHDEEITNQGVLPAKYSLSSALTATVRVVVRRLRALLSGRHQPR